VPPGAEVRYGGHGVAMTDIRVTPSDAQAGLDRAGPGDTVVLGAGTYRSPLRLVDRAGTAGRPIELRAEPGAVLDGGVAAEDFRLEANRLAKKVNDGEVPGFEQGTFPGLYPFILDGRLLLQRCRNVALRNLRLERGWPTLIALDGCQDILISGCEFTDGTFAVGAAGADTYGLTLEDCSWVQDRVPGRMWREIDWTRIHGNPNDEEDGPINLAEDWRLFDGDFVRGEGIRGGLTVRRCSVTAAFNGIHLFNQTLDPALARDVEVHDCLFREIRDNILEPESAAFNWWFYRNEIVNAHKWFSFECRKSGYFYLFANRAWFNSIPGPPTDKHRGGGVFKLGKKVAAARGPHYVVHNSFSSRSDYARKGIWPRLSHQANALRLADASDPVFDHPSNFFGDLTAPPKTADLRFTTEWTRHAIAMQDDVVRYPGWPEDLRQAGYPLGPTTAADPRFQAPFTGDLTLAPDSPCRGRAPALTLDLPDGGPPWTRPAGADVGAWQGDALFQGPEYRALSVPVE
jgi:hypothetical protein